MGNLGNDDIFTVDASGKRQLERVVGDARTLKYKRRKVSAIREFPQGCGRYALRINEKPIKDIVDVPPVENLESKTDALEETICVKLLGSSIEPVTPDVDKSSVDKSFQLSKYLISETSKSLESLDKADGGEQVKIVESPKVLDETEVVNPSKTFELEKSDLSKKESLDSMNNSDKPVPTGLLRSAQPAGKELLEVQSPIGMVPSDLPVQLKLSDHSQTLPIVEAVEKNVHKKYPPRRRISACRDFPKGCGRSAPRIMREGQKSPVSLNDKILDGIVKEDCQKSVISSKGGSSVNEKEHTVGGDTKQTREKQEYQKSVRERCLVNEKEHTVGGDKKQMIGKEKCKQTVVSFKDRILVKQSVGEQVTEKIQNGDAPRSKPKAAVRKEVEEEVRSKPEGRSNKETIEHKNVRVPPEGKLKREDTMRNNNKPLRKSDLPLPDLKSPPSIKLVVSEAKSSGGKLGKEPAKLHKDASLKRKITGNTTDKSRAINQSQEQASVDLRSLKEKVIVQGLMAAANCPWRKRPDLKSPPSSKVVVSEAKSSGGKLGKEPAKLHKDTSLKINITGKTTDKSHAINQSQGRANVDLRSLNEKVIVQGLMAAANCPWRQGKRLFKSPGSITHATARSKEKK